MSITGAARRGPSGTPFPIFDPGCERIGARPLAGSTRVASWGGQYKGSGEQFLHFEGEGVGYVCWLRGKPDSQHEITLTMLAPLSAAGEERD